MKPEDSFNLERIADALECIALMRVGFSIDAKDIIDLIIERRAKG